MVRSLWFLHLLAIWGVTGMKQNEECIVFTPDGLDALAEWIPESEVQLILRQIKDFEPEKQPLAFEDIAKIASHNEAQPERSITSNKNDLAKRSNSKSTKKRGSDSPSY